MCISSVIRKHRMYIYFGLLTFINTRNPLCDTRFLDTFKCVRFCSLYCKYNIYIQLFVFQIYNSICESRCSFGAKCCGELTERPPCVKLLYSFFFQTGLYCFLNYKIYFLRRILQIWWVNYSNSYTVFINIFIGFSVLTIYNLKLNYI